MPTRPFHMLLPLLLALPAGTAMAVDEPPASPRCELRANQLAASVRLNVPDPIPRTVCLQRCDANLVAPRREAGVLVALAIYNGRLCGVPAPPARKERRPAGQSGRALAR